MFKRNFLYLLVPLGLSILPLNKAVKGLSLSFTLFHWVLTQKMPLKPFLLQTEQYQLTQPFLCVRCSSLQLSVWPFIKFASVHPCLLCWGTQKWTEHSWWSPTRLGKEEGSLPSTHWQNVLSLTRRLLALFATSTLWWFISIWCPPRVYQEWLTSNWTTVIYTGKATELVKCYIPLRNPCWLLPITFLFFMCSRRGFHTYLLHHLPRYWGETAYPVVLGRYQVLWTFQHPLSTLSSKDFGKDL